MTIKTLSQSLKVQIWHCRGHEAMPNYGLQPQTELDQAQNVFAIPNVNKEPGHLNQ